MSLHMINVLVYNIYVLDQVLYGLSLIKHVVIIDKRLFKEWTADDSPQRKIAIYDKAGASKRKTALA